VILGSTSAFAQVTASTVIAPAAPVLFTPGNLVLSRSIYAAKAVDVPFPRILPNGAPSAANGSYPNVFNNESPDPAFGITSPILLDQMSRVGTVLNTFNVTSALAANPNTRVSSIATSFTSKSEFGLSVTPDGTSVTLMA
jgi:hypothetical protein